MSAVNKAVFFIMIQLLQLKNYRTAIDLLEIIFMSPAFVILVDRLLPRSVHGSSFMASAPSLSRLKFVCNTALKQDDAIFSADERIATQRRRHENQCRYYIYF